MIPFDLTHPLPTGRTVLEASAGTGKTYSLTGLIVRFLAEAGVGVDQFLVVTFTRAAANELRDRTRSTLDIAATALRNGEVPASHPWMSVLLDTSAAAGDPGSEIDRRRGRVADAITRFDELTITTIHGFCQQALAQLGVRSGNNPDAVLVDSLHDVVAEVCRDAIITELADHPTALNSPGSSRPKITNPKQAESELIATVTALMSNPGAEIAPKAAPEPVAARWVDLALRTHDAVVHRQEVRNEIGYDTLISGLQRALTHPEHGEAVALQLSQRSSVVLVDEFQDTDRLQWEVFDRAFSRSTLITVGDPKQAIYRFRGADVHAYLDAVRTGATLGLITNHRSDRAVLDGLAHLFDGATLGDPRIPFVPVQARPDAPLTAFAHIAATTPATTPATTTGATAATAADTEPGVHLRVVPVAPSLRTANGQEMAMPLVRSLVLDDLVARTIDLLDHGTIRAAGADGDVRSVCPGDIAVLVPSHAEADNVAGALRRARIPAVRTRTGSVLQSPAATQWRLLLAALAQPHQTPVVRAAALGWFLRTDVLALADDDEVLAALQGRAVELAERMRVVGISAFYDEQKARMGSGDLIGGLVATVLGRDGGDRHLTDLDHISELLATALQGRSADPAQVLRVLDQLIGDTDERNEAAMRRIDSDALAVQITTIHSAKGLEYPIVLVPFGFKQRNNIRTPFSYTTADGRRTLDLASRVAWDDGPAVPGDESTRCNQELRRHLATCDDEGDDLRLLYVALTRAKHRLEIWWASTARSATSALGRLLLDREGAGPVLNTEATLTAKSRGKGFNIHKPFHQAMTESQAVEQIRALARDSDGTIACHLLDAQIEPGTWTGRAAPSPLALSIAASHHRRPIADPRWTRWSFSRLGSVVEATSVAVTEPSEGIADRGGFDEPADVADVGGLPDGVDGGSAGIGAGTDAAIDTGVVEQLQLGIGPVAHLADVVGGTRFGTFVHSVLEQLDCTSADLAGDVRALVVEHAAREGLELAIGPLVDSVVHGLVAAVRTPLGPLFGGRALADIAPRDRLAELNFDMPIADATGTLAAGTIGDVLLRHLPRHDPLRPFATALAQEFAHLDIAGWMHGSIDAVFRVQVDGDSRYVVVDYKTNRLHTPGAADPVAAYHPLLLIPAMEHSRYPLQALLYTLALHRYLRWRLGAGYSPERHLGGTAYLFLRGMVGPQTPMVDDVAHGVFSWRPPVAAVLALDHLLATGRAS